MRCITPIADDPLFSIFPPRAMHGAIAYAPLGLASLEFSLKGCEAIARGNAPGKKMRLEFVRAPGQGGVFR
ncbi:hypothetical protein BC643_0529 [Mangrovibacterium diazotrophicum]|uniref:Uncharacterized protein n=1 Tax=Mangrovibacterium diazotrophicum TaxID=1261403 RepID=A0A419W417_9BACT|nr:hypothetical protein BC643_0529 [Mangrovibacterium diazotrophicum]